MHEAALALVATQLLLLPACGVGHADRATPPSVPTDLSDLASKGYASDMDGFVARLCQQSKRSWDPALTASAINAYVRAGFATN